MRYHYTARRLGTASRWHPDGWWPRPDYRTSSSERWLLSMRLVLKRADFWKRVEWESE
jgi:hypothetical protein